MKIYVSGAMPNSNWLRHARLCETRLLSCHGPYMSFARNFIEARSRVADGIDLMLDSGAFTAWSRGSPVTLDDVTRNYTEIVDMADQAFNGRINVKLINLDVIPGRRGVDPTFDQIAVAETDSDHNFDLLHRRMWPYQVLPVFHQGERWPRLNVVMAQSNYICISPRNDLPERQRVAWAVEAHRRLREPRMTHGLATTSPQMMLSSPWHSVDSATWMHMARHGIIQVLVGDRLRLVAVTPDHPRKASWNSRHFDRMSLVEQLFVSEAVMQTGTPWRDIVASVDARADFNIDQTNRLAATLAAQYREPPPPTQLELT